MKKRLLIITAIITAATLAAPAARAQDFREVYRNYKSTHNLTKVYIPKAGFIFASLFLDKEDDYEAKQFVGATTALRVIALESGYDERLDSDARQWVEKHGLEELISVRDEGDEVDIYVLEKDGAIRQLVIIAHSEGEQAVIHIKGRYTGDMIRKAVAAGDGKLNIGVEF